MADLRYPPGPRSTIPGRYVLAYRRNPLAFLQKLAHEYGDIAYLKFGSQHFVLLNHPDLIKDVLVTHHRNFTKGLVLQRAKRLLGEGLLTSEGNFHLRQRRLVQPAFHRQRIHAYGTVMTDYAVRMRARWQDGMTLDIAQEMRRLTLAVVGKALFNADVEAEADQVGEALSTIFTLFSSRLFLPLAEVLEKLPLPANFRSRQAQAHLNAIIYRMIDQRRSSGEDQGDLLSMLLLAQDEENDGDRMSDIQVRDEALTLFLAGHETTANALTWTWYLLGRHPEVEAQLHAELDMVLGGRLPTVDDLPQLPYTRMVLSESMRLYPPAWGVGRRAIGEYEAGGYMVPAGSIIVMSQYLMHRDGRYYSDPLRFDPQRWTPEAQAKRPKFAYFPFGGGPRVCIGEGFAWMEGTLLLATIAQHWRMRLVEGHPVALHPLITLRPKYGMRMTIERRALSSA